MDRFAVLLLSIAAVGCVESFGGSNIQLDFAPGTLIPARGAPPAGQQPPADTFMALYAVDATGSEEIERFELQPVIDRASPCFIELEDDRYPGLHVTSYLTRVLADTGIADPLNPPASASEAQRIDALLARDRDGHLAGLESQVKAVTSPSAVRYGAVAPACAEDPSAPDPSLIPPPSCTGDASNERRLALCRDTWAAHPELYEGSDKVFTLPLNGSFFGAIEGQNPINGGQLGGSSMFVDEVLIGFDAYQIRWQWKDFDGDGEPDYPPGTPPPQMNATGNLYMEGEPETRTRGVISVRLEHPMEPTIAAEMSVFADLDEDEVHF